MEFLHPFTLSHHLGTLAVDLGYFPLDNRAYPLLSASRTLLLGIRSLVRFGKDRSPLAFPVLYPQGYSYEALPK